MSDPSTSYQQPPDFSFTQYELVCIKQTWDDLHIMRKQEDVTANSSATTAVASLSTTVSNDTTINTESTSTQPTMATKSSTNRSTSRSTSDINLNLHEFQYKLCKNIFQLENEMPSHLQRHTFNRNQLEHYNQNITAYHYEVIESSYQVTHMVQLISIMINCLEFNKALPVSYLTKVSKVNSRVNDIDALAYKVFGEALILTVIEYTNETQKHRFIYEAYTIEHQAIFNKFITKLLNLLIFYSSEQSIAIPNKTSNGTLRPNSIAVSLHSSAASMSSASSPQRSSLSRVYSEISNKSSQLSLYPNEDESASIGIVDLDYTYQKSPSSDTTIMPERSSSSMLLDKVAPEQSPRTFDNIKEADESDSYDEDDSYHYLNSFAPESSKLSAAAVIKRGSFSALNKTKKGFLQPTQTKKSKHARSKKALDSSSIHSDTQDNCTIM